MSKTFFVPKMSGSKNFWSKTILRQKCFGSKEIWGLKKLKKIGSFKIIAHRFLIKTNVGKILGAERFGPKQFGPRKKLSPKKCWSKKVWIQKNNGSTKFWVHKIFAPKKILGPNFF